MRKAIDLAANGKLLITGEYLVLSGATALALPVRFGQKLHAEEIEKPLMEWESYTPGGKWFNATLNPENFDVITTDKPDTADNLRNLLSGARRLNPLFINGGVGFRVAVMADYPPEWGLGSSSTLISLVARWANVDTYELFRTVSGGSGYDVACAERSGLLFYTIKHDRPEIIPVTAGKALRENTFFAWLGNKQDTKKEVDLFLEKKKFSTRDLERVSALSTLVCRAESVEELIGLTDEHEAIVGRILQREPIARRFPPFPGTVKSLGAWGGDFAMFVSGLDQDETVKYIGQCGFSTIFSFGDMAAFS
jgi:mevalonate kinase